MSNIIPVFFACDDNFVKFTMVAMKSAIENCSKENHYHFYILNTDIHEKSRDMVMELATENVEISFENVSKYLESISHRLPIRDYYSKTTYFRLFIAEMFPQYDKVLYVDSDTVILGDLADLYNTELGDNYVGAAKEQVMVQTEEYGTYVEKVLGIDRNNYFNAGILVINCKQFRHHNVLDQFVGLLKEYNFVVTQDEDYLNVICKNRVTFVSQVWNTEMFGELVYPIEEAKIIHYVMTSKPWHYEDCRCGDIFWKYTKMLPVFGEIKKILDSYTDEQKERDRLSCERLLQIAISEINREDNYLNLMQKKKQQNIVQASDRLLILEKIAQYEKEGLFDQDVELDPPSRMLMPDEVDYLRSKLSSKIKTAFAYHAARKFLNSILKNKQMIIKEIIGIENFANLESGAIITCNHFNAFDSFAIQVVYEAAKQKHRKFFRVIREGNYTNFPGFYGSLMRNCNTLPLSSNVKTMQKFVSSTNTLLKRGHFVLVYPEQSMWWNYRKPKPLKKTAFSFAVKNNVPVLPCFITMKDTDILDKDGFFIQEYTVHVSKPIYPDSSLSTFQNIEKMRTTNYEDWKDIYESTYGQKLEYTFTGDISKIK